MSSQKTIAIIGGGITGLSAAYYLQKEIKEQQLPYGIKLLEASGQVGGKIRTEKRDGFIIERGPDSFLARKEPAVRLAENLGLQNELVRNQTGQAYILIDDKLHKMPKGFFMGVPMSLDSLQDTSVLSEEGKKRAAEEVTIPESEARNDQSLGSFFRGRFGDELVGNVIEPLLSGIYSGDIDEMSLLATFPNFLELEQQYGSLIKGLEHTIGERKSQPGKTPGQFYAFKSGMDVLVQRLVEEIGEETILLNHAVEQVTFANDKYIIHGKDNIEADAIVMATPNHVLSNFFPEHDFFQTFEETPFTSVANVAMAFDQSAIEQELDGTGFVVSRNSNFQITACTWTHKKWEHTAPEGKALLRAYVGKPSNQEVVDLTDEELLDIVLKDLKQTMQISEEPEFTVVTRWKEAMPQYTVGHKERINKVRDQMTAHLPGAFFSGSSYEGVGIPDCIGQAEQAVKNVLQYLE
ncbi:protoporphyrinogen oxidase [Oceanobacillus sp. CAU 1775]